MPYASELMYLWDQEMRKAGTTPMLAISSTKDGKGRIHLPKGITKEQVTDVLETYLTLLKQGAPILLIK